MFTCTPCFKNLCLPVHPVFQAGELQCLRAQCREEVDRLATQSNMRRGAFRRKISSFRKKVFQGLMNVRSKRTGGKKRTAPPLPSHPSQPSNPSRSLISSHPSQPSQSSNPSYPSRPSRSSPSSHPSRPSRSSLSSHPSHLSHPSHVSRPSRPFHPSHPSNPSHCFHPSHTSHPSNFPEKTHPSLTSRPQDQYLPSQPSPASLPIQDPILSFLARGEVGTEKAENLYVGTPREETSSDEDSSFTYNPEKDEGSSSGPGRIVNPRVSLVQCKEDPERIIPPRPVPRTSLLVKVNVQNPEVKFIFFFSSQRGS